MTDPFASLRGEHPGRFATSERIEQLSLERFKPWPSAKLATGRPLMTHSQMGFVRNERFGSGLVIPGTNRAKQRNEARKAQAARK